MLIHPYFIYLDSKIIGTAKQICVFFDDEIFSRKNTVVLIKKYKHKSAKQIQKVFKERAISYRFVVAKDIDDLQEGIVFYPFNAQSNCRVVANRRLKHIFITHGESNKAASVKPIIRIYDHVCTAGQAGIERFLEHGIFSEHDVNNGRLIKTGNTFIGKTGLSKSGQKCILYAPTWEGGVEQENYSSLGQWQFIGKKLIEKANEYKINIILIRPHPNTGYRLYEYTKNLFDLIKFLREHTFHLIIFSPNLTLSWRQYYQYKKQKIVFKNSLKEFCALFAICDISAIETQLLNESIPYQLVMELNNFNKYAHYNYRYIKIEEWGNRYSLVTPKNYQEYRQYLIADDSKTTNLFSLLEQQYEDQIV